ncbi:MAG: 3-phosphoshikimate 1-carboxyvinyltransferase [Deltaproteobacteria bacterium]|nr:3-phosphoshikimate 1-carboxyvinyltransferase [Deltaproteobacteria bacterium]
MNINYVSFQPLERLEGIIIVPGDKSISHRALFISSLASGISRINNILIAEDVLSTIVCLRMLGVDIKLTGNSVVVKADGIDSFKEPAGVLNAGNSGTTTRIILGILSTRNFFSVITGDDSLSSRPMRRITAPLMIMGASIDGRDNGNYLPVSVRGGGLKGINYNMPVASAQVKTGLILASTGAKGVMSIKEPISTRDHTERMLKASGVNLKTEDNTIELSCSQKPLPLNIVIPGDFSSAAFFIGAALIAKESDVLIKGVGINYGRTGLLDIVKSMGAKIELLNERYETGESVADIHIKPAKLKGIVIDDKSLIVRSIDEIPVLAVIAACADGETVIRHAEELRVKETDRIKAVVEGLTALGIKAKELDDGMVIQGGTIKGGTVDSHDDHRIAMAFAISSVASTKEVFINDFNAVGISFPEFMDIFNTLRHR